MEQREKCVISATHDEVNRGILPNPNCNEQALYFERIIEGIDEEMASEDKKNNAIASSFKDSIPIDKDPSGVLDTFLITKREMELSCHLMLCNLNNIKCCCS